MNTSESTGNGLEASSSRGDDDFERPYLAHTSPEPPGDFSGSRAPFSWRELLAAITIAASIGGSTAITLTKLSGLEKFVIEARSNNAHEHEIVENQIIDIVKDLQQHELGSHPICVSVDKKQDELISDARTDIRSLRESLGQIQQSQIMLREHLLTVKGAK